MIELRNKRHIRSLASLFSVRAVSVALDVIFFIFSGRHLDIVTFGEFAQYLIVYMIAIPIVSLGSNQLIMKQGKGGSIMFVITRIIYSLFIVLLLFLLSLIFIYLQDNISIRSILLIVFLLIVSVFNNFLRSHYQAHLLFRKFNLISFCSSVLAFIIPITMILSLNVQLWALYWRIAIPGIIAVFFLIIELLHSSQNLCQIRLKFSDITETIYITSGGVLDAITQQMLQVFTAYTNTVTTLGIANRAEYIRVSGFQQVYLIISSYLNVQIANSSEILKNRTRLRQIYMYYMYIIFISYSLGIIALPFMEFIFPEEYDELLVLIQPLVLLAWGIAQVSFYLNISILNSDYRVVTIYSVTYGLLSVAIAFIVQDYISYIYGNLCSQFIARLVVLGSSKYLRGIICDKKVIVLEILQLLCLCAMFLFSKSIVVFVLLYMYITNYKKIHDAIS